ncbi:MAG: hypothetical protein GF344_19875 [Chitinivibrionales bacterium]|nr:hypothetical protein [Chitinivibrionales bacterium]
MRSVLIVSILSIFVTASFGGDSGEIFLAGEQDGFYERGEYLVWKSIVVRKGKALTFAPGSVVRFKPMSGIDVEGTFKCLGTPSRPIVMTSDNDRLGHGEESESPRPFDWNGIRVSGDSSRVILGHVRLLYSTYGLEVANEESVEYMDSVVFKGNGRQNIAIGGHPLPAQDGKPFSWGRTVSRSTPSTISSPPATSGVPKPIAEDPQRRWRVPAKVLLGGVAVVGGVLAATGHLRSYKYYRDYKSISTEPNDTQDAILRKQDELRRLEQDIDQSRRMGNIGLLVGVIGAVGFGVTFLF